MTNKNNQDVTYNTHGLVFGNFWGGGKGSFPATEMESKDKSDLIHQLKEALKDGSLDSGMGYESLTGALITIERKERRIIDKKDFYHVDTEDIFIGDLTDEEKEFLVECDTYN